jgi:hypothetical protein
MDDNWPYVLAGYALTTVTLTAYVTWLWQRLRRAEPPTTNDD